MDQPPQRLLVERLLETFVVDAIQKVASGHGERSARREDDALRLIRIALLDERFQPVPGYTLADCVPLTVSGLRREVAWKQGGAVRGLTGKKVRLLGELAGSGSKTPRLFALYLERAK